MLIGSDLTTIAWKVLKDDTELNSLINGQVYNGQRPFNSEKQDITVNALIVPNEVIQFATVIVNFFTPDIQVGNTFLTDQATLSAVTKRIIKLFESTVSKQLGIYNKNQKTYVQVEYTQTYKSEEQEHFHISSTRLKTRTINI